jgi:hypothetical protein
MTDKNLSAVKVNAIVDILTTIVCIALAIVNFLQLGLVFAVLWIIAAGVWGFNAYQSIQALREADR